MGIFKKLAGSGSAAVKGLAFTLKSGAKSALGIAARINETGIFDGVPLASNILSVASTIQGVIEHKNITDKALMKVSEYMGLTAVTFLTLTNTPGVCDNSALETNLSAIQSTISAIETKVNHYHEQHIVLKLAVGDDADVFDSLLEELKSRLETLHFAVSGQTFSVVIDNGNKLDEALEKLDGLDSKMSAMLSDKSARDKRAGHIENLEIDEKVVQLELKIASGAFGDVFMAAWASKTVVVKKIDIREIPTSKVESIKSDFFKEVSIMAALRSPNTVQIYGCVKCKTELMIVMEFCPGGTLRSRLDDDRGGWTLSDIVEAVLDICEGMKYLHAHGVLHLDLKSFNILVDAEGCMKVADFGQSKSASLNTAKTMAGGGTGTAAWNAPGESRGGGGAKRARTKQGRAKSAANRLLRLLHLANCEKVAQSARLASAQNDRPKLAVSLVCCTS